MFTEPRHNPSEEENPGPAQIAVGEMRTIFGFSLDRIRNAVEVLACRMLEQKLEGCPEIDKSRDVIEDIYCLALNRVPALYYHSASSFARQLEDQGPPADIFAALDKALDYAIIQVIKNPSRK